MERLVKVRPEMSGFVIDRVVISSAGKCNPVRWAENMCNKVTDNNVQDGSERTISTTTRLPTSQ